MIESINATDFIETSKTKLQVTMEEYMALKHRYEDIIHSMTQLCGIGMYIFDHSKA